ncbi:MAG: glycogen/starch synthase [Luteolibacter sp.]
MTTLSVSASPLVQKSPKKLRRPRILIVSPELNGSRTLSQNGCFAPRAKAGGLADIATLLVDELIREGLDVHVAIPDYGSLTMDGSVKISPQLHLCPDREFAYRRSVYDGSPEANRRAALALQREVIHHVLPRLRPDIVHCHDWMTALIPAAARNMGIKSLFTIHNLHDERTSLAEIEDRGIDAARFWDRLHFGYQPHCYEESRDRNPVNWMASAVHAADRVNTVSPSFMEEMIQGRHFSGAGVMDCLRAKHHFGCASGILNAPDPSYQPDTDPSIAENYDAHSHASAKVANKVQLQKILGLEIDPEAPLLLWPSRLDPVQKGCQLLAEELYQVVSDYWALGLQVAFIADGPARGIFEHIADFHHLRHRIGIRGFDENLSRLGNAAADFALMPSSYEPCGLAQMVALKYGCLPIARNTGGLRDTVRHLNWDEETGNGFVFDHHSPQGLRWAIDEAMRFYIRPPHERARHITRVMLESVYAFSPRRTVEYYLHEYSQIAGRDIRMVEGE